MRAAAVALALALLLPSAAWANLDFYIRESADARYDYADLVDITDATGPFNPPNNSPYRVVRVITTRTKAEVSGYLAPKTSGQAKRRLYYLDETKMSPADALTWSTVRMITVPESAALGWLSRK
jgi:hypothetical protein